MPIGMVKFIVKDIKRFTQCGHIGKRNKAILWPVPFPQLTFRVLKWDGSLTRRPGMGMSKGSSQAVVLCTVTMSLLALWAHPEGCLTSCYNCVSSPAGARISSLLLLLPEWDSSGKFPVLGAYYFISLMVKLGVTSVSVEYPYFCQDNYMITEENQAPFKINLGTFYI